MGESMGVKAEMLKTEILKWRGRMLGGRGPIRRCLFESIHAVGGEQGAHLGDGGDGVKAEILKR